MATLTTLGNGLKRIRSRLFMIGFILVLLLLTGIMVLKSSSKSPEQINTDVNRDGITDTTDYFLLKEKFAMPCRKCAEDLNNDGIVDVSDILLLLSKIESQ